jgi:uncharacterized protein YbjT (DUF2867 family)
MNTRIGILGATGVYGRHLTPQLTAAGYRVRAQVRKPAAAISLDSEIFPGALIFFI